MTDYWEFLNIVFQIIMKNLYYLHRDREIFKFIL